MKPRPDRRRPEPYFKVQHRDAVSMAWTDHWKEAFATLADAISYVEQRAVAGSEFRVMEFRAGKTNIVYRKP